MSIDENIDVSALVKSHSTVGQFYEIDNVSEIMDVVCHEQCMWSILRWERVNKNGNSTATSFLISP